MTFRCSHIWYVQKYYNVWNHADSGSPVPQDAPLCKTVVCMLCGEIRENVVAIDATNGK